MEVDSKVFLRKKFMEYYGRHEVAAPPEIERREFGVGTLESKIKIRHKSFPTQRDMNNYLRREVPFYISYSSAYYMFPENQPMPAKNWLGADLVFDLDVDMQLLDAEKLMRVKEETVDLLDFLAADFGFSKKDIEVNFSGGKGYHLKVFEEKAKQLDGEERREVIDYVTGTGLDLDCFIRLADAGGHPIVSGPREGDPGWAGRIYEVTMDLVNSDLDRLQDIDGVGPKTARRIHENRERYVKALKRGNWGDFSENISSTIRQNVLDETAVKMTGDADKMVTIDTSRLIRLPDTIHGGSGLVACKVKDLDSFDPLTDALAFGGEEVKVEVKEKIPGFDLNETRFKFDRGMHSMPEYAAVYLLLKDKAESVRG